ncbi:MAG: hypothetical protein WBD20_08160 [Pirellulaceae bacterium]
MTYITRPMMWLAALVTLTSLVLALIGQSDRYKGFSTPIIISDLPIIESKSELSDFAEKPDRVQVRLGRVLADDRDRMVLEKRAAGTEEIVYVSNEDFEGMVAGLRDFKFPMNTEAMTTDGLGDFFQTEIAELKGLRRLRFETSYSSKEYDIKFLSDLKKLEVLELGSVHNLASFAPLRDLPNLHTLTIRHNAMITKEQMADVARIPALENLYLTNVSEHALDAVSELGRSSSLKSIFVAIPLGDPDQGDADHLVQIQSRVPNISVRSSRYRPYRLLLFGGAIWYALTISFLGMHLCGQFSSPQAELIPGYRRTHRKFTWALLGTFILVSAGTLCWLSGSHLTAFLSAYGLAVIAATRSSLSMGLLSRKPKPSRLNVVIRIFFTLALIGCFFWFFRHPMVLEEFLMGRWPWVVVSLSVLAIVVAVDADRRMNGLCRDRYEAGAPLMFSMHDLQKASADRVVAGDEGAKGEANPQAGFEAFARGLGAITILLVFARLQWGDQLFGSSGVGAMLKGQIVGYCVFFAFMIVFVIGAKWWQRMPFLATMMTRPPNRLMQINSVLAGVRRDFLFQMPPFAIALILIAVNAPFWGTEHIFSRVMASALFICGAIYICYVAVLWSLIIRTLVGMVVLVLILQFGVTLGVAMITMIGIDFKVGLPAYRVIITAIAMTGFATAASWAVRRKYFALEWGRLL